MSHSIISLTAAAKVPTVWGRHPDHDNLIIDFEFQDIGHFQIQLTETQAEALSEAIRQELQDRHQPQGG